MFIYQLKKVLQGRQILYITLSFTCSILSAQIACEFIGCMLVIGISFITLIFSFLSRNKIVCILMIAFWLGAISYATNRHALETKFDAVVGKYKTHQGNVLTSPKIKGDLAQYEIEIAEGRLRLSLWKGKQSYKVGDVISLYCKVTEPLGARNPNAFDNRNYLRGKGIGAETFAEGKDVKLVGEYPVNPLFALGYSVKMWIVNAIKAYLPEQNAALLNSMLIGYTDEVDEQTKQDFNTAGLTHLMAVSGMNVTFVLLPILFLAKKLRQNRKRAGIIGLGTLFIFLFITGFAPSIVRACLMGALVLLSRMIDKDADFATSIALAALLMEVVNPMVVFDLGFQFSFCATIGIVLMSRPISKSFDSYKMPKTIAETLSVTIAAQLSVMPIMISYFNQVSLVSLLSNLLVVPMSGVITVLGFVLAGISGVSLLADPVAAAVNLLIGIVRVVAQWSASLPGAIMKLPDFGIIGSMTYFAFLIFLFQYKKFSAHMAKRTAVVFLVLCMILVGCQFLPGNRLQITVLDVGQGDSIFITTPQGRNILIDTGDGKTPLSRLLLGIGIAKLDLLILTHSHADHVGGVEELKKWILIDEIYVPANRSEPVFDSLSAKRIAAGNYLSVEENLSLSFLNPQNATITTSDETSANDNSVVALLTFGNFDMLLTGDIGQKTEAILIENQMPQRIEVLKVAHHGSNESSSENFLSYNVFQNGIISVGKNMYGHPNPKAIARLQASGCRVLRTDYGGAVTISTDGSEYSMDSNLDVPPCGRIFYELGRPKKTYRTG